MPKHTYLVFAGAVYYPAGGGLDFVSSHTSEEEAVAEARRIIGRRWIQEKYSADPEDHCGFVIEWSNVMRSDGVGVCAFTGSGLRVEFRRDAVEIV